MKPIAGLDELTHIAREVIHKHSYLHPGVPSWNYHMKVSIV